MLCGQVPQKNPEWLGHNGALQLIAWAEIGELVSGLPKLESLVNHEQLFGVLSKYSSLIV